MDKPILKYETLTNDCYFYNTMYEVCNFSPVPFVMILYEQLRGDIRGLLFSY